MGKGDADRRGKKQDKDDRKRKRVEEPEESQGEQEQYEDSDEEMIEEVSLDIDELLKEKLSNTKGSERVALEAIHTLLNKTQELEDQKDAEIEQVNQKYFKKMEPLLNELNDIVEGKGKGNHLIMDKKSLTEDQISKGIDGIGLPDYWLRVFDSSDFRPMIEDTDRNLLKAVSRCKMSCERGKDQAKITMELQFNKNPIVRNKEFKTTFKVGSNAKGSCHCATQLDWISNKKKVQLFEILSGKDVETKEFFQLMKEFFDEVYPRSLYYYFDLNPQPSQIPIEGLDSDEQDEQDEQGEQDDEDEEEEELEKPRKKQKKNPPTQKKSIEKPQCKTQ